MMPMIGKVLQKGVKQQPLIAIGMIIFFFFCYWGYEIITPNTPKEAFFWMLIMRGIGMGLLFIPITALSLSTLKGQQIGQGAAFTGMMRQLGGSFGIAVISTYITRRSMQHRSNLVSYINTYDPQVQQRLQNMMTLFKTKGMSADKALEASYKVLDLQVSKQVAVLSYMDVFLYLGIMFLICVPFILFAKTQKSTPISMADAH
jgi:DHA2 family multidrug resistance protein